MGVINPANTLNFISSEGVLETVKEDLSSYNSSGLLDPGSFYEYIRFLLHNMGAAVYDEVEAIVSIKRNMGRLPDNFCQFWDAYKVKSCTSRGNREVVFPQDGFAYYTDVDTEIFKKHCNYTIEAPDCLDYMAKITVRDYLVQTEPCREWSYCYPELLSFGITPASELYNKHSPCLRCNSPHHINITKKTISTNFENGEILLRYYGIGIDPETSLPMVPENPNIERALVYDIEYRVLRKLWINKQVSDLERVVASVAAEASEAFQTALNELKTPAFTTMMRAARMNRNRFNVFQIRRTDHMHAYPR